MSHKNEKVRVESDINKQTVRAVCVKAQSFFTLITPSDPRGYTLVLCNSALAGNSVAFIADG